MLIGFDHDCVASHSELPSNNMMFFFIKFILRLSKYKGLSKIFSICRLYFLNFTSFLLLSLIRIGILEYHNIFHSMLITFFFKFFFLILLFIQT